MNVFAKLRKSREAAASAMTDVRSAVAAVRTEIASAQGDLERAERRAPALDDAQAGAAAAIAKAADRGRMLLRQAARRAARGGPVEPMAGISDQRDVRDLLAAIAPDAIADAFAAEARAAWRGDEGADAVTREADEVAARLRLFELELIEERLAREAEAVGISIPRRRDQHIAALLARDSDLPS